MTVVIFILVYLNALGMRKHVIHNLLCLTDISIDCDFVYVNMTEIFRP